MRNQECRGNKQVRANETVIPHGNTKMNVQNNKNTATCNLQESTRQICQEYYSRKKEIIDYLAEVGNPLEQKAAKTFQIASGAV